MSDERLARMLRDLATIYDACGVGVWMLNPQKRWDGASALDLIQTGRIAEVDAAVEQLTTGAHT
jgi:hypothetical protein